MTILSDDPRVAAVPVHESYQELVTLGASFGPARARVRAGLAARLRRAQVALPVGLSLRVVEGHRSAAEQPAMVGVPPAVAAHVAGAAVDVTLVDCWGVALDLGTPIQARLEDQTTREESGRSSIDPPDLPADVRARRALLSGVLTAVGLVNDPTTWWHWSYGDRYWALVTGADAAIYGPVVDLDGTSRLRRRWAA